MLAACGDAGQRKEFKHLGRPRGRTEAGQRSGDHLVIIACEQPRPSPTPVQYSVQVCDVFPRAIEGKRRIWDDGRTKRTG